VSVMDRTLRSMQQSVYSGDDEKQNAAMLLLTPSRGGPPEAKDAAAAIFIGLKPLPEMK
jgi:hypothetical protein